MKLKRLFILAVGVFVWGNILTSTGSGIDFSIFKDLKKAGEVIKETTKTSEEKKEQESPAKPTPKSTSTEDTLPATAAAEDMKLYTKYDFIPGDKVIFYDDMSGEEEGEFPYRWNLEGGVFEVVKPGKEFWIMCTSRYGHIRPKIKDAPLPLKYTVEMEFYDKGPGFSEHGFTIFWVNNKGSNIGSLSVNRGYGANLSINNKELASIMLPEGLLSKGVHTMRIMATTRSIKCYIDNVRVANVPKIENFSPVGFRVKIYGSLRHDPKNPCLFRGFRFAEGGKSMREQIEEEGKIVTHGILFDPGSSRIKAESYKTLKQIGQLLMDDEDLRLSIEGHTDSDGSEESNLTLSQNRANSVREYLISTYNVSSDRLKARGWGESKPIDTNKTPEGKANNRRVELIKLEK